MANERATTYAVRLHGTGTTTMTEVERDNAELSAIASQFAAKVPGHDREVEAFANELLACRDRQLTRQLRAVGVNVRPPTVKRIQ